MSDRTYSKDKPIACRLRGKILFPGDIQKISGIEVDDDDLYSFIYHEIEDTGQDITDPNVLAAWEYQYKHDQIVDEHTRQLAAGCPTSLGFKIDCLPSNVSDFDQTLSLLSLAGAETVVVRDYDNKQQTLTVAQYRQMCLDLGAYVMTLRHNRWAAIDALGAKP